MKQRLAFMAVILLVALAAAFYFRTRHTRPSITPTVAEPVATSTTLPPSAVSAVPVVPPVAPPAPARTLPAGWEGFLSLKQGQQLNRVTAAMDNHTLPADVLAFFEKEISNGIKRCALGALGQIGEAEDLSIMRADLTHRNRAVQLAAKAAEGRLQARLAARTEVKKEQQL